MYSAICQICRNKFTARAKTTKYCSACVSKAKAEAALHRKEQLNRPLTTDTEFWNHMEFWFLNGMKRMLKLTR